MPPTALPEGWRTAEDELGRTYWWNYWTREVRWTRPGVEDEEAAVPPPAAPLPPPASTLQTLRDRAAGRNSTRDKSSAGAGGTFGGFDCWRLPLLLLCVLVVEHAVKLIGAAVAAPSELPLDPVLLPDPGGLAPKWWLGAALLLAATVAVLLRGVARVWASGDEFSLAARIAFALVAWAVALVGAVLLSLALPATTLVALAAFAPPLALVVATVHRLLAARHYTLLSSLPPSPDGAVGLATAIRFAAVAARACALPASDVCLALLLLAAPLLVWAWAGVTALALGFTAVGLAVGYALTLVGAVALAALAWRDTLRAGVLVWLPLVLAAAVHSAAAALLPLALTAANVPAAPVVAAAFLGVPSALGLAAAAALLAERDWRPTVAPCVAIALAFAGCSATAWSAAAAGVAWGLAAAAQALLILLLLVLGGACVPRRSHARLHRALFIAELVAAAGAAVGLGFGSGVWAGIGVAAATVGVAGVATGARAARERVLVVAPSGSFLPVFKLTLGGAEIALSRAGRSVVVAGAALAVAAAAGLAAALEPSSPAPAVGAAGIVLCAQLVAALAVDLRALPERRLAAIASHVDASLVLAAFSAARRAHDAHALSAPTKGSSTFKTARGGSVMHGGGDAGGEWTEEYDEKSGARYYFQPTTGASQWEPPQLTTTEARPRRHCGRRRRRGGGAGERAAAAAAGRGGTRHARPRPRRRHAAGRAPTNRGGGGGRDGRLRSGAAVWGARHRPPPLRRLGAAASCARARRTAR